MIHQYKSNGYAIVLDVNSGSVHVVDDIVYDCIALLDQGCSKGEVTEKLSASYSKEDLKTALEEIQELTDQGMLFTEDIYENAIEHFKERPTVVKALCLHIAHDCNLACQYCFAEEGEYHGQTCTDVLRSRKESTGFPDRQFRKQTKSGSGLLRRGTSDELAGCQRPGSIRKRAGKDT